MWTLLDTQALASPGLITFSSIPSGHRALMVEGVVATDRGGAGNDGLNLQVGNGTVDSGANYSWHWKSNGSASVSAGGDGDTKITVCQVSTDNAVSTLLAAFRMLLLEHDVTTYNRQIRSMSGFYQAGTQRRVIVGSSTWLNTADAIDIMTFSPNTGTNLIAGSTLRLWGGFA